VTALPGTTRDLITQTAVWRGVTFELTDTGGMYGASQDPLHELVFATGLRAIRSADVLVLVVDGREGRTPGDDEIASALRETGAPVVVAINKIDDRRAQQAALDFYRLGFECVVEVSAEHGQGVGDLLDEVVARLPAGPATAQPSQSEAEDEREEARELAAGAPNEVRVAIVGRPNVGKSSLVNRLMRRELVLVSEVPGTTRDAVDALLSWNRRQYRIVDTAGIRRPGRVARSGQVESLSVIIARRSVAAADVAVLVIDAVEGPTEQDGAIAGEAERAGCGVVIAANKWDLVKARSQGFADTFDAEVRRRLKFLEYAPLVHISALTGERTPRLLEVVDKVAAARRRRVTTGELNRFVERITVEHPPASPGRKAVRILYAAQVAVAPPTFVFFTNIATTFHFSYERFLVNRLRDEFGFMGTPIRIQVRSRRGEG
jgi:GTP-binding protein